MNRTHCAETTAISIELTRLDLGKLKTMNRTQYQDEYCGMGGRSKGGGGSGGGGGGGEISVCTKSYDIQPVGGRMQAKHWAQSKAAAAARQSQRGPQSMTASQNSQHLPLYDADFVATAYSAADRGTHRVQPQWRDPRWSDETRVDTTTLYNPADRDPPNRSEFYTYRSTRIDPMSTPSPALAVPDVHKLRYMHNEYMTYDDWYNDPNSMG